MELRSFLGILVFSMYDLCYSSVGRASWALGIRFESRSAIQWDILGFRLHWVWVGRPCEGSWEPAYTKSSDYGVSDLLSTFIPRV